MKTKSYPFAIGLAFLLVMNHSIDAAFADTFEFLSFTPPKGWAKEMLSDGIAYRRPEGVGLVAIYSSYQASASAAEEFAKVWGVRLQNITKAAAPPPRVEREGDFTVAIGARQMKAEEELTTISLVTFVGRGRSLSMIAIAAGDDVQAEVNSSLDSVSILPAASAGSAATTTGTDVDFAVPPGYVSARDGRMVIIKPTVVNENTPCVYAIGSKRPSSGNLETDALRSLLEPLPGWQLKGQNYESVRGISDAGWPYFRVRADAQMLVGGSYQYLSVMAMAFPAGAGQVNIVWGFGSLARCTGEEVPFARLFHSLRPSGVPSDGGRAFAKELTGTWQNSQGVGIARYTFLPNGRYEFGQSTSTTFGNLETRNSSVGDGAWNLNGPELTIRPDGRGARKFRVRIFDRNTGGKWWRMMFLLDESANPPLDVRYERIEN